MKTYSLQAEGEATFTCYVEANSLEEAVELFNKGEYEVEQNESYVTELGPFEYIEEE